MLTCKSVSKALEEGDYNDLSFLKRLGIKIHVAVCFVCGRYNKQVMHMHDACSHFRDETENEANGTAKRLSSSKKLELEAALSQEMAKHNK